MMTHDAVNPQPPSPPDGSAQALDVLDGGMLSTEEVAVLLGVDPSTLRRWRTAAPPAGPPFTPLSPRVTVYSLNDVRSWIAARRIDPAERARWLSRWTFRSA